MSFLGKIFGRHRKKKEDVTEEKTETLITFIGLSRAGKSTIMHRLRTGEFHPNLSRTMGLNVDFFEYRDVKFHAFDLGGQTAFQELWSNYLRLSKAVVFVVDTSNPSDFLESREVTAYD